ncbi:MAG: hypothetical protein JXB15_00620, partial [Anaerolineales bacterium]|nr:hypothetical protein [Anaerolineales bacterium]
MKTPRLNAWKPLQLTVLLILLFSLAGGASSPASGRTPPDEQALPTLSPEDSSYQVVRAYYTDRQMVNALAAWLEPWEVHHDKGYLVVGVSPQEAEIMLALGFRLEVDQRLTDLANQPLQALPGQTQGIPGYECYRTVEETFASAQALADAHPHLASWIDIGDSWEKIDPRAGDGYDLMVLRLTSSKIAAPKPVLFITSAIHAREYTTAELATRFAEYLVNSYNLNADATWLLDYHEIHLLLQSNPDGRKKAETGASWRKNTNRDYCGDFSDDRGADLNRNFEFEWGCCGGSSPSECAETYRGPTPASEPETQAIQNYARSIFAD